MKPGTTAADDAELVTAERKVHLCAVEDVWSNRIVGYAINERVTARLAVAAGHASAG